MPAPPTARCGRPASRAGTVVPATRAAYGENLPYVLGATIGSVDGHVAVGGGVPVVAGGVLLIRTGRRQRAA
ncbi:hypothetical protein AB0E27_02940 [Streptomyces sparsogenes]|uniref:hypothetical protein n=1 Tax=Streptomyces sparsogenes TaxID=67365 RepID=UPI00340C7EE4